MDAPLPPAPSTESDDADRLRLDRVLEALSTARDFPHNTCGSSRHLEGLCTLLLEGRVPLSLQEDPVHVGESLAAVLTALFVARTTLLDQGMTWTVVDGVPVWTKAPSSSDETPGEAIEEAVTPGL